MKRYGSIDKALDVCDALLTPDEEQLLLAKIKEKGVECKEMDKLLRANMQFIVSLANKYKSKGVDFTDLIWIIQDAFADAALQYEPTAETKFLKFAIQRDCYAVQRGVAEDCSMMDPCHPVIKDLKKNY